MTAQSTAQRIQAGAKRMTNDELMVGVTMKTWNQALARLKAVMAALNDDDLMFEVSPGRNRVYYLVGHVAAIHDRTIELLGLGERLYPELDEVFIINPDRTFPDEIPPRELRDILDNVNSVLTARITELSAEELLKKHEAVSSEDFAKDPLRNRLAVLSQRIGHIWYHAGQIRLASKL